MTRKQNKVITVLSVIVFLLLFMLASRVYFRFDITRNKVYTLSDVSKNLYQELDDTMRITYFVSDRLAQVHPLPDEIAGLLNEYAAYSRGRIQFVRKDPVKSNMTREMEYLGIFPQIVRLIENSEIISVEVYTGITIEYFDRIEVLPLVFSYESLEYEITTRILALSQGRERELGIIIGESLKQWDTDYLLLSTELRRFGYKIRFITAGEEIPDTLPVLFVLGGADEFDNWALYRIDRYIQCGGNVLFAQGSLFIDLLNGMEVLPVYDNGLFAMIANYGAAILPALVLDSSSLQISYELNAGTHDYVTIPYPLWVHVDRQGINANHPVTRNLSSLNLYWASPIELYPPAGVIAEPLFTSSLVAWLQTRNYNADPVSALHSEDEMAQTRGRKILGAVLTGIFPSFFDGVAKPIREGSLLELPDMPLNPAPSRIIVVGNTDFAGAMMEIGGGEAGNLDFLLRAADWLMNDEETIALRRHEIGRLDRITDLNKRKAAMDFSRVLNVFVIPFLILVIGLVITQRRKKMTGGTKAGGV